ncbi:MAG: hypothetical protein IPK80_00925 [Nannocystis sp.]|nr:hypothetical protein [Nannocystis sp.]
MLTELLSTLPSPLFRRLADGLRTKMQERRSQIIQEQVTSLVEMVGSGCSSEKEADALISGMTPDIEDVINLYTVILLSARGKNATAVLTRMTAQYWHEKRPSDTFFRRFGRLLGEIEDAELKRLGELIGIVLDHRGTSASMTVEVIVMDPGRANFQRYPYDTIRLERHRPDETSTIHYLGDPDLFAVFRLIRSHGFAIELPGGVLDVSSHALALHIAPSAWHDLEKMSKLLNLPHD